MKYDKQNCPKCNYTFDILTSLLDDDETLPKENDLSICIKCGTYLAFDKNLKLEEIKEIDNLLNLDNGVKKKLKYLRKLILFKNEKANN